MRLTLGNIVHIQDFFGVVAEGFGWDTSQVVYAKESDNGNHHQDKQAPAGDFNLPAIAGRKSPSPAARTDGWFSLRCQNAQTKKIIARTHKVTFKRVNRLSAEGQESRR